MLSTSNNLTHQPQPYQPTFYLEGLTHAVGKILRKVAAQLDAQAVSCFIGHEHSPGDLRLVYQHGLSCPESLYGVLSRRNLKGYYNPSSVEYASPTSGFNLIRYSLDFETELPTLFRSTPAREEYTFSLQRVWSSGGCPDAAVFFNFRVMRSFQPQAIDETLQGIDEALVALFNRFWESAVPQGFRGLMRAADTIGARLFFEMRDFDSMTRGGRNRAFRDLIDATIQADPILRTLQVDWDLYSPTVVTGKPDSTVLLRVGQSNVGQAGPQEIRPSTYQHIESWAMLRNNALRFSPQRIRAGISRFAPLLSHAHLKSAAAIATVPFSAGDEVVAICTLRTNDLRSNSISAVTAAQNRLIRSLWFNGRRLARVWHQANERRLAVGLRRIVNCFVAAPTPIDAEPDDAEALSQLFCEVLGACNCNLWERADDEFRSLSKRRAADRSNLPRSDGWSRWVTDHQQPVMFRRASAPSRADAVEVMFCDIVQGLWRTATPNDLDGLPIFRLEAWDRHTSAQLALPLRVTEPNGAAIGVVWIHYQSETAPAQIDVDWAMAFADEISRMVRASRSRATAIHSLVEHEKTIEFERTLSHLRHETLKLIPQMIRRAATDVEQERDAQARLTEIRDCADLLEANLLLYTTLDVSRLPTLMKCELVSSVRRGVHLMELSRNGSQPKAVFVEGDPSASVFVSIDARLLWGILLNLVTNSRLYRYRGFPARTDETIYVSVIFSGDNPYVRIDDAGKGMTALEKENAGKCRFPHDQTRGDQGAGMGLLICWKALEQFGTWSFNDSRRGGTTVDLNLNRI